MRTPFTILVEDTRAYQEVRNEVARHLEIDDVKTCVFVQATPEYGMWYKYGGGIVRGAVMGRHQGSGNFYSYSQNWFDVEDELDRHVRMIQPSTQRRISQKAKREEVEPEAEDGIIPSPYSSKKPHVDGGIRRSKRISNRTEGLIL